MRESHFFQNCGTFCFDLYWKYHNFERNEIRATAFVKWTDFRVNVMWYVHITSFNHCFKLNTGRRLMYQNFHTAITYKAMCTLIFPLEMWCPSLRFQMASGLCATSRRLDATKWRIQEEDWCAKTFSTKCNFGRTTKKRAGFCTLTFSLPV